jgi:RimJ/RimL family protein N-acetyltransferase
MSEIDLSVFTFATARLQLRPLEVADEALYHELYTDPDTMRFIAPPLTTEQATNRFRKVVAWQREPSFARRFLVMLERVTQRPIGICGTSNYDAETLRLEVGIVLKAVARSRGLAREALVGLINKVFAMSSVREIYVRFSAHNVAMERTSVRVGFTPCADAIQEQGLLSERIWSVHRSSWRVKRVTHWRAWPADSSINTLVGCGCLTAAV